MELSWWMGLVKQSVKGGCESLHIGIFLDIHYCCDRDTEVGGRTPEVCIAGALLAKVFM